MFDGMSLSNPLVSLRNEMDRLFSEYGGGLLRSPYARQPNHPPLNVWDEGDTVCVEAEIPGVRKDDLEVYAVGTELTLKGRRHAMEGEKLTYHRQERGTDEFTRVVMLPMAVDAEKIEAVLNDGVLTLRLPKAEEAKPRQIKVKTN